MILKRTHNKSIFKAAEIRSLTLDQLLCWHPVCDSIEVYILQILPISSSMFLFEIVAKSDYKHKSKSLDFDGNDGGDLY